MSHSRFSACVQMPISPFPQSRHHYPLPAMTFWKHPELLLTYRETFRNAGAQLPLQRLACAPALLSAGIPFPRERSQHGEGPFFTGHTKWLPLIKDFMWLNP